MYYEYQVSRKMDLGRGEYTKIQPICWVKYMDLHRTCIKHTY